MNKRIFSSTLKVAIALFLIKILGLLKQMVIAAICGTTAQTDAYFIANGIMIALCSVIFSALSISLLSMYTERLLNTGRENANNLINCVLKVFIPVSICIALLFAINASSIAKILAPSYIGQQLEILAQYIRILSVLFVFTCYYLIINVILETDKRFLPGKGFSLFQNLFILIAAIFFYQYIGIVSLLYATVLAALVQCIQVSWFARKQFRFRASSVFETQSIQKLIALIVPLLIGNAIYEANDIVDKQISSGLSAGSVSVLTYGASINEIVTTLIISSVSTVLFSHYATWVAENAPEKISKSLRVSLEYLLVIILPIMILCFVCGQLLVQVLYGRGNFGADSVIRTGQVVICYAIGFFFQAMRANIVRVFYAFQDTRTPMINGALAVSGNICLSLLLSHMLGAPGIALATSISMGIVTLLFLPKLKKLLPSFVLRESAIEYGKTIGAAILVFPCMMWLRNVINFDAWLSLLLLGLATVFLYMIALYLFKVQCFTKIIHKYMKLLHM